MAVARLANDCGIAIVLKEIPVETSVEAVHTAMSKFGIIKMIKMQLASCAVCKDFGHMSLSCHSVKDAVVPGGRKALFSAQDQFKLARIYVKKSVPISCSLAFSSKTWISVVGAPLVNTFHNTGMSLGFNKIGELLFSVVDNLELCLNQKKDIVMGVSSDEVIGNKTDSIVDLPAFFHIVKLENMLEDLFKSVLSLSACFDKTKLRNKAHPWLVDKFDDVCMFSSGLNSGYMGAGVAIVINRSLAKHVYKISEVLSHLLCIRLLFKNKLLVSILGLYAHASLATQFSQANEINSLIVKAMNESSFVILGGNFNENGSYKCISFKKCHDLGLINSLDGSFFAKVLTWSNSWSVAKTIDYVFVSSNLVNAIIQHDVFIVSKYFDIDYKAVSVSLGLGGVTDNSLGCQVNNKPVTWCSKQWFPETIVSSIACSA
ncbi:hypothetical protein G9A89_012903 [Geosiphon pyriformis]|nr:hypothetical protein G9A89_012903 [Geosiphon pyriformis]